MDQTLIRESESPGVGNLSETVARKEFQEEIPIYLEEDFSQTHGKIRLRLGSESAPKSLTKRLTNIEIPRGNSYMRGLLKLIRRREFGSDSDQSPRAKDRIERASQNRNS